MEEMISIISQVGFPIFACIYMARFMRADMQKLVEVVDKMADSIDKLNERLDRLEEKLYD